MSERKTLTSQMAVLYRSAGKSEKATILNELCELTGWRRDHARKGVASGVGPERCCAATDTGPLVWGLEIIEALCFCWESRPASGWRRSWANSSSLYKPAVS